jgi:hypothetical protein
MSVRFRFLLWLGLLILVSACAPWRALVVFDNKSECGGAIAIRLTNERTGEVIRESVPEGERVEIAVKADDWYAYIVDFTAAGRTADNFRCTSLQEGRLRIPQGSVPQVFVLQSQRQTAVPTATATP